MAIIPVQELDAAFQAAGAVNDFYANDGEVHLLVQNTSGSPKRVRFKKVNAPLDPATPSIDWDETVANATLRICTAVHPKWYNRPDGTVEAQYPDGNTGLTVSAVRIRAARSYA
jgi:hypothetical protein